VYLPITAGVGCIVAVALAWSVSGPSEKVRQLPPPDVSPLPGEKDTGRDFTRYYKPPGELPPARMLPCVLPLQWDGIVKPGDVEQRFLADAEARQRLLANGFVVVEGGKIDDITKPYESLIAAEIPIYVTADTVLHLFHIQFDETLKDIEERVFLPDIMAVTRELLDASYAEYQSATGMLKEAARRNLAYFSVAMKQFEPDFEPRGCVAKVVAWECKKITKHEGLPDWDDARARGPQPSCLLPSPSARRRFQRRPPSPMLGFSLYREGLSPQER